jgi:hypothetical protein
MGGLLLIGAIIVLASIVGMLGSYLYGLAADLHDRRAAHAGATQAGATHPGSRRYLLSDEASASAA